MNAIPNATQLLAKIVRANGTEVYSDRGAREDAQGLMQETYNIRVVVYEIETDSDALYFIETNDNGDMREFEQLEIEDGQDIAAAVKDNLQNWDSEWIELFEAENII
jgi:hypothetical protein